MSQKKNLTLKWHAIVNSVRCQLGLEKGDEVLVCNNWLFRATITQTNNNRGRNTAVYLNIFKYLNVFKYITYETGDRLYYIINTIKILQKKT